MGDKTAIEWADASWNPTVGCSVISPGCKRCYAMKLAARLERMGLAKYAGLTTTVNGHAVWNGVVRLAPDALDQPIRWRKPRQIFVDSMSDLGHETLHDADRDKVFAVMLLAHWHTYMVLTKRPDIMCAYLSDPRTPGRILAAAMNMVGAPNGMPLEWAGIDMAAGEPHPFPWPMPNVWIGTSVEDRARLPRLDLLRRTPAVCRFVSFEPLLECLGPIDLDGIHLAITGGESGEGFREVPPEAVRSIRDHCTARGVAFHFKQWGGLTPKSGGRDLDGRTWDEMPFKGEQ